MLTGRFPRATEIGSPYRPGSWSREQLDPVQPVRTTRRQWVVGAIGLLAGVAVATGIEHVGTSSQAAPEANPSAPELPDWAREMLTVSPPQLLNQAGEYERKSWQHVGEGHLAPGFERLLEVVLESGHHLRDVAGQCAVRSLSRLGRADLLDSWLPRLEGDRGLKRTLAEAVELNQEWKLMERARRRRGKR